MENSLNKNCLPESWELATVNDISLRIHYGYTATATNKNTGVKYLRITDVQDNKVDWRQVPFCEIPDNEIEKFVLHKDDLVFARTGGTVGKSFLIKDDVPKNSVFASYLIRIVLTSYIESKLIAYFFQSNNYWSQIELGKTGLKTNVSAQILSKIEFSLPPLPEQRAIVAKIEQLFSELDNGIASLKKAQEQLKVYRQAVLKWAFEGKLTEKWRAENKVKLETAKELLRKIKEERQRRYEQELADYKAGRIKTKPKPPKELSPLTEKELAELPQLPEGWGWEKLGRLCPFNRKCAYGVLVPGNHVEDGIPLVRVGDIDENGRVNIAGLKKIDPEIANKFQRTFLEGGEILISLVGAIGRTAIAPLCLKGANTARAVGVIPLTNLVNNQYVELSLRNPIKIQEHIGSAHEVARKTLNLEDVERTAIPLCSISEQHQIVLEIEARLSVVEKFEQTISESLQKAEALRQSILKKAFEGKLLSAKELETVRKDPEWEPAEKLLERIKAEKQHLSKGRKP